MTELMPIRRGAVGFAIDTPHGELPIRHVVGIGLNYADHARETGADTPTWPVLFTKNPASICLHQEPIRIPPVCRDPATGPKAGPDQTDYEAELAVVIGHHPSGTPARDLAEHVALEHVLGYACANDVSARWWQKNSGGGQFCRGKSFATYGPIGPAVVPAASVPDPQDLAVRSRLNGTLMQEGRTRDMIFPVAGLLHEITKGTTLLPGTVILTGTPAGVGFARDPRVWLREGDTIEIEIEGPGFGSHTLTNPVTNG